jgi:hypothetical protein
MWNWFNCYFSGRHDYGMWCEPGAIYLRCIHCGRRSPGWDLQTKGAAKTRSAVARRLETPRSPKVLASDRVLPFRRSAAR